MPKWRDNAGSIVRRILFFLFSFKVKNGDTKLGKKLKNEFAYILQACIKGYLKTVNENDSKGIWNIVPEYFKESRETMSENTNGLTHFLKSDLVTFGPKLYCRQKVFVAAFNDHCKENHHLSSKWTNQFYAGPFSDFNLKVVNNSRKKYPNAPGGKIYTETFIIGVDVKNMEGEYDESSESESE
jgi:phage/plasmid-associated DNA primase